MTKMIEVVNLKKNFTLHNQGGAEIAVFDKLGFSVQQGECIALYGQSGTGKSTLLRSLYANYKPVSGAIKIRHNNEMVDITQLSPRELIEVRKTSIGYVSQFLRVIPRVSTLDIVASAHQEIYGDEQQAHTRAVELLQRLNIPQRLWSLAPATFSGGEQQRVNIARGFIVSYPILLLDEPTASLDRTNSKVVVELIKEAKEAKCAVVGIFHDDEVREAVADRCIEIQRNDEK